MPEKKTDLATAAPNLLPAILHGQDASDEIFSTKDNMVGVTPQVPRIEILREGQVFRIAGSQETFPEFNAVIVAHHATRTYYSKPMGEGANRRPDCSSSNGLFGSPGQADDGSDACPIPPELRKSNQAKYKNQFICATCPKNEWGTEPKGGRGKACKERHVLYLMPTDPELASKIPFLLRIAPSSLGVKDRFFTLLTTRGIPHQTVITKLALKQETNAAGQEYSELIMEPDFKKKLARPEQIIIKELLDLYRDAFQMASAEVATESEEPIVLDDAPEQAAAEPEPPAAPEAPAAAPATPPPAAPAKAQDVKPPKKPRSKDEEMALNF